jgi:uncharacterized protein (TIGR03083 family)
MRMTRREEDPMGAKSEALARQFEAKAQATVDLLETLSDADWKATTEAERWTVGVTAHHLATVFEPIAGMITGVASGQAQGGLTMALIDEMNARHAQEHADCTRAETIALFRRSATTAAAVVRGLKDDQLARSAAVFADAPPMTAEQIITGGLLTHVDEHAGSIRRTVGR